MNRVEWLPVPEWEERMRKLLDELNVKPSPAGAVDLVDVFIALLERIKKLEERGPE